MWKIFTKQGGGGNLEWDLDLRPISAKKGGGDLAWIGRYGIPVLRYLSYGCAAQTFLIKYYVEQPSQKKHMIPAEILQN